MTARALGARGGAVQTAKKANVTRPETNRNADATEPYGGLRSARLERSGACLIPTS